jgi:hypothetical protein
VEDGVNQKPVNRHLASVKGFATFSIGVLAISCQRTIAPEAFVGRWECRDFASGVDLELSLHGDGTFDSVQRPTVEFRPVPPEYRRGLWTVSYDGLHLRCTRFASVYENYSFWRGRLERRDYSASLQPVRGEMVLIGSLPMWDSSDSRTFRLKRVSARPAPLDWNRIEEWVSKSWHANGS